MNDQRYELKDVGLTHPDNNAFVKIDSIGRIYIMSEPNLGIVIDPRTHSIAFIGDSVKMMTKPDEGLKWNNLTFNPQATNYAEPTFLEKKNTNMTIYDDVDRYLS